MRFPAAETAEKHRRLVDVASRLFRERGVGAVSVSEVMKASGMTHGAFPSHFANKDELASAALQEAMEQTDRVLTKALADPATAKHEFLKGYLDAVHRDRAGQGCPMAALAVDIGRRGGSDRAALTRYVHRLIERATSGFSWSSRGKRRDQAILMTSAMVGAVILARAVEDAALSEEILTATRRQLLTV